MFQSFTQADTSTTRKFGGTGLGLAICRKLVELMGGSIGLNSTVGKGSTFWFTLPFVKQKLPALPVNGATATLQNLKNVQTPSGPVASNSTRIILAEDNKINQIVTQRQLKKLGYNNVTIAGNGIEAMEAWQQDHNSIILMGCQMPEMDGYEATQKIRELEREKNLPHTRIVAMTASTMQGDRETCLAAGMDAYISKPVDIGELKDVSARLHLSVQNIHPMPTSRFCKAKHGIPFPSIVRQAFHTMPIHQPHGLGKYRIYFWLRTQKRSIFA